MGLIKLNPLTERKLRRFRLLRRGWYSFLLLSLLIALSLVGELLVNSRAIVVRYDGNWHFPTYGGVLPGTTFGLAYTFETNYRELREKFRNEGGGNYVIMPPIPYNPYEMDVPPGASPTRPPNWEERHLLGTDTLGRDVLARLFYGFRVALLVASAFLLGTYIIGIAIGAAMGYFGGMVDLLGQRVIEIWTNLPFLLIVIIVSSLVRPSVPVLIGIFVAFSWLGMTYYMRTAVLRERSREYVSAAHSLGAHAPRVIFHHILPNVLATLVTFVPFTIAAAVEILTAVDFLGFGIPAPTPSWGELLRQGTRNLNAPWIVSSAFGALVLVLLLVTFIGEAVREAFDPRKHTIYQ